MLADAGAVDLDARVTTSTELDRPASHGVGGAAEQVDHAPLDFAAQCVPVDVGRQLDDHAVIAGLDSEWDRGRREPVREVDDRAFREGADDAWVDVGVACDLGRVAERGGDLADGPVDRPRAVAPVRVLAGQRDRGESGCRPRAELLRRVGAMCPAAQPVVDVGGIERSTMAPISWTGFWAEELTD